MQHELAYRFIADHSQQGMGVTRVATSGRIRAPALWLWRLSDGAGHH